MFALAIKFIYNNSKKKTKMKKTILFVLTLSLFFVACDKNKNDEPKAPQSVTLDGIVKEFKFIDGVSKSDVSKKAIDDLNAWVKEVNDINKLNSQAKEGKGGYLTDGSKKRVVNAKGVETVQLVKKGLVGALQLNNFNTALMGGVMGKDANARKAAVDKAVKYLLGTDKPKTKDEFKKEGNAFGKYMMSVAGSEKYKNIDKEIYKAIKDAYDNVDNPKEYNQHLLNLNKYVTTVVAFRAVHYIAGYTDKLREEVTGHVVHELSEGLGFAYSLQFAYNGQTHGMYLDSETAKKITEVNLWEEAKDKSGNSLLDKQSEAIAKMFGFTVADAK